jgi:thioredoxin reductase
VIGGGAAGLSAALVLGRARRRVVVVDAGSPRNAPAAHFQGETEDAVVAFQRDAGINIDGQVGEET